MKLIIKFFIKYQDKTVLISFFILYIVNKFLNMTEKKKFFFLIN
jgi:hypothetical protein